MGGKNAIETVMGAAVIAVAALFVFYVFEKRSIPTGEGYPLTAVFEDVTGVAPGSEVRIGGIKVGTVADMELNSGTYQAVLTFFLRSDIALPEDTSAAIVGESLLGGKFVALQPGGSETMLKKGGEIRHTQSSTNLEEMIGKFMFSGGGVDQAPSGEADGESSFLD